MAASQDAVLSWVRTARQSLWVAASGGDPIQAATPSGPVALVVGNEGAGVSAALASAAQRTVAIPLRARAESLNAGVAAGILLWELLRER